MDWPAVALDTRVGELAGKHVAVRGIGPDGKPALVLATFGRSRGREVRARVGDTSTREPMPVPQSVTCPGSVSLRAFVLAHTAVRASGAAEPRRIKWPISGSPLMLPKLVGAMALLVLLAVLLNQAFLLFFAIPLLTSGLAQRGTNQSMLPPSVVENSWQLFPSQVVAKTPLDAALAGPTPRDRVDMVKATYGQLMGDIIYRIENSALFDGAQASTNRFQVALLTWDATAKNAPQLADEVEDAFAAARRDAERLGLDHLPETARNPARRAAKAAVTALGDAPKAEKAVALSRMEEILTSLALYYLPVVERGSPSLIGERPAIGPSL